MTFVDSNILFDLATDDSQWFDWSLNAIEAEAVKGPLVINAVVYSELSARYGSVQEVDGFVEMTGVQLVDIPRMAGFLAAKAFGNYRAAGGTKTGVLSDFFIGAHAIALDIPVLTRDIRRYRTYFPELRLIAPQLN